MPYSIEDNNPDCNGFAVVKDDDKKIMGCHETKEKAQDQITALNISEQEYQRQSMPEQDLYETEEEALAKAKEIGCVGTHTHEVNGKIMYMPCEKMEDYTKLTGGEHTDEDDQTLKYNEQDSKSIRGVKYHEELEFIAQNEQRNKYIRNLALALNGNTLCLFQLVEKHGQLLYKLIKEKADKDRKIFFVYGGTDTDIREEIRAITEREENAIIVASYGTFSTGINIRNLHNIIFSSPSKSRIRNLQSIGRGLRIGDNKTSATLYDISDDLTYKDKKNFTLTHFQERINIYNEEGFNYEIHSVNLK